MRALKTLDLAQLKALSSGHRVRLMSFADSRSSFLVAEAAHELGITWEAANYHVRRLLAVGVLRSEGTCVRGKARPEVFALSAKRFVLDRKSTDGEYVAASVRLVKSIARESVKSYEAAMAESLLNPRVLDWLDVEMTHLWLDARRAKKVKRILAKARKQIVALSNECSSEAPEKDGAERAFVLTLMGRV